MRVFISILWATVYLFATASAVLPGHLNHQTLDDPQDHDPVVLLPGSRHHRFLQNSTIDSRLDIRIVDHEEAIDRRDMTEEELRTVLEERRTSVGRRRSRQLKLKGSKQQGSAVEDTLEGNVRRRVKEASKNKSAKSKSKSSKSKSKSKSKKCKGKGKGGKGKSGKSSSRSEEPYHQEDSEDSSVNRWCDPQIIYLFFPNMEHFYVDHCYYHYYYYPPYHCEPYHYEAYQYTQDDMDQIQARLETMFDDYNVEFTQDEPMEGEYSTITFACLYDGSCIWDYPTYHSILFGAAEKIDLYNLDRSDNAFVQAQFWQYLKLKDPEDVNLRSYTDAFDYTDDRDEAYRLVILRQASRTAAHETGHILGCRHHDSFGPPGMGIASTVPFYDFYPTYEGLDEADETFMHIMGSGASVRVPFYFEVKRDDFFGTRCMVKLLSNEQAEMLYEEDVGGLEHSLKFNKLETDITLPEGVNAGKELELHELFIKGRIGEKGETDFYRFKGKKGEVLSGEYNGFDIFFSDFDVCLGALSLYCENDDGTWTLVAMNHQNFEGFDAFLIDAVLPQDGTYIMEVYAPDAVQTGYYRFISLDLWGLGEFREGDYYVSIYKIKAVEEDSD